MHKYLVLLGVLALCFAIQAQDDDEGPIRYFYMPSFGNKSRDGSFNVRFYGIVYRRDDSSTGFSASDFINDQLVRELQEEAQTEEQRRNLENNLDPFLHWDFVDDQLITFNIQSAGVDVRTTDETDNDGLFDQFLNFRADNAEIRDTVYFRATDPQASNPDLGNATIYSADGYSVIADMDDVLRITEVWKPKTALENVFMNNYQPVPGMPQLFRIWQQSLPNPAFHYATETPILLAPAYVNWLYGVYPFGPLDFRPVNIFDPQALLDARQEQLRTFVETYPQRKFILVGDTDTRSVYEKYPQFARDYPNNVACVFIRNLTHSYPDYSNPLLDLEYEFRGVPRRQWFVFNTPEELYEIDIPSGNCHPPGVPDNQTTSSGGYEGTGTRSSGSTVSQGVLYLILSCLLSCMLLL